ncbi:MAG: Flp family type IVb pilin [Acidobacteria bacterium]|nr:Flp family type IVb pilin [Acidobacteriota bacterium]
MLNQLSNLFRSEEGQGLVEYTLLISLIALVTIGTLTAMGQGIVSTLYGGITVAL